ncbi:MAG: MBL fold metallo-hydrolase [Alphaproteobacteria bacterium]|nr:MBL fold metallo-hydrolase [Alphaproteobacteria bacterium]
MSASEILILRILGSGSSGGVPRIGADGPAWGACDPLEPKNRRTRCSALVSVGATRILIDTAPDMREQLIAARCGRLDAALITHPHADQTNGIDDLRMVAYNMRRRVDVYGDEATLAVLKRQFGYCFETPKGSGYPPILTAHELHPLRALTIAGEGPAVSVLPFEQDHGGIHSLGFRIGPIAYTSDAVGIPEESFAALKGVQCWIVDALRYQPHPTHAHVEMALGWIARVRPKLAVLTNLHVDLDYQTLKAALPEGIVPAYDGMEILCDLGAADARPRIRQ